MHRPNDMGQHFSTSNNSGYAEMYSEKACILVNIVMLQIYVLTNRFPCTFPTHLPYTCTTKTHHPKLFRCPCTFSTCPILLTNYAPPPPPRLLSKCPYTICTCRLFILVMPGTTSVFMTVPVNQLIHQV